MVVHRFASPARFGRISRAILPWTAGGAALAFAAGLYLALVASPADYQQGDTVRIMYVHVPAAWMAVMVYTVMAGGSVAALVWRHPLGELAARAAAPLGAGFTLLCLVTGSLWGQPMWGTWWVWDARLTSVLVLFFLYLGYIALANAFDDPERGGRAGGLLAIVGLVNLPIIKFSVDWWNTLHQPASITKLSGPSIHSSMLWPLLTMALAYLLLFLSLLLLRIRAELADRKLRVQAVASRAGPVPSALSPEQS